MCLYQHKEQCRQPLGCVEGALHIPGPMLEGLECHLLVRWPCTYPAQARVQPDVGGQLGNPHPQQHPHQAPASVSVLSGCKVTFQPKDPLLPACRNEMENKPQTLQNTKNVFALSAQVYTLDIGVKQSNFAVNCRKFPIKESQTGPKSQRYEKERTIIQNIQAFPWIS